MMKLKQGDWLICKKHNAIFEVLEYLPYTERYIIFRRIPYCTGLPRNLPINIIKENFDVAPSARILYGI